MRSLNLDRWHLSLVQLMNKIGNKKLNNILEFHCSEVAKPLPDSERKFRDSFIQCKYMSKDFMNQPSVDSSLGIYVHVKIFVTPGHSSFSNFQF